MSEKGIKVMQTFESDGDATSHVALLKTVQYANIDKAWKNKLWAKYKSILGNGKFEDDCWSTPSDFFSTGQRSINGRNR